MASQSRHHTRPGPYRNNGIPPDRGRSARDAEDDIPLSWREKGLKKRAKAKDANKPGFNHLSDEVRVVPPLELAQGSDSAFRSERGDHGEELLPRLALVDETRTRVQESDKRLNESRRNCAASRLSVEYIWKGRIPCFAASANNVV